MIPRDCEPLSSPLDKPETVTVTVKTKWLWILLGIALCLLAVAPVVSSALPSAAQNGGGSSGGASPPGSSATPNCSNPCNIIIVNSLFGRVQPIIVKQGTTVDWQNKDNTQHTTTSDTPGIWDSGILSPGQSYSITFNSTGTFTYHCNIHPMTGTIEVVSYIARKIFSITLVFPFIEKVDVFSITVHGKIIATPPEVQ
jgi:Cupredoxin-like domain